MVDQDESNDSNDVNESNLSQLDKRVISAVRRSPKFTIRPARLATELGISIDDASAELCGLLAAVGGGEGGASFRFEEVPTDPDPDDDTSTKTKQKSQHKPPPVMVFEFPPNFERKARSTRRNEDFRLILSSSLRTGVQILKVFVAFGLILSLLVLCIAALTALIAAIVAMASQRGHDNHRSAAMRRMRSIVLMLRELLWCYALFGGGFGGENDAHHPFLRDVAGSTAACLSICCGNPFSMLFWMRASRLSRRNRLRDRRWGGRYVSVHSRDQTGYAIVPGTWGHENDEAEGTGHQLGGGEDGFRGLLSITVEFLFGPKPFWPGPSEREKWRIRAVAIASRPGGAISLKELMPYADRPSSLSNPSAVVASGLLVVAHFNGVPVCTEGSSGSADAMFRFPELVSEAEEGLPGPKKTVDSMNDSTDDSWETLFYAKKKGQNGETATSSLLERQPLVPPFLNEQKHVLTKLQPNHFGLCVLLGGINLLGIHWLGKSLSEGGSLELPYRALSFVVGGLIIVLDCYAKLFFVLPLGRLVMILVLNALIEKRNKLRSRISRELVA